MPKKITDIENENKNESVKVVEQKIPTTTDIAKMVKSKAEQMKAHLDAQPQVSIMIPLEKGEKKGAVQPFTINGYRITVPKGRMTTVPEQVAQMISERFDVDLDIRGRSIENQDESMKKALDSL